MKNLCLVLSLMISLAACKEGYLVQPVRPSQFSEQSFAVTDYDATHLIIIVKGQALADEVKSFHQVQFYDNPQCGGETLGATTASVLDSKGAELRVSHRQKLTLYYKTNTGKDCHRATESRSVAVDPVPPPRLNRTSPESPSRNTTTVAILGSSFPSQAVVELYSDPQCIQKLTEGPGSQFDQPGLLINIPPNSVTPVAARTLDPRGVRSDCELLVNYEHRTGLSASVEFITTSPLSPSNDNHEPVIFGRTNENIVSVELFTDSACSNSLGSTTPDVFESVGVAVTLPAEASTFVYARGLNIEGDLTGCLYMTQYLHDSIAPAAPTFTVEMPPTPTRLTALPLIQGIAPLDAALVRLYSDDRCEQVIGFGTVSDFNSTGITANLPENSTTSIFATSRDNAGNESACTFMISYKHNTIPPLPPTFTTSIPTAPTNQTAEPFVIGIPSQFTSELRFFDDMTCSNQVGIGGPDEFAGPGIQVALQENTNNFIYTTVRDIEGNWSECTELTSYDHSNLPAPNPIFTSSFPPSPTRLTTTPSLAGSAEATVTDVEYYLDAACANLVTSGSRGNFASSGLPIGVHANAVTSVYAKSKDIYGNESSCQHFTDYTHTVIPPMNPTFLGVTPLSPNNVSFTPTVTGTAFDNIASPIGPVKVSFHDNASCVGNLGSGTPAEFNSTGIQINVAPDAPSSIYARAVDLAGNFSDCSYLTDYIHNTLKPGRPLLGSLFPDTPSYTPITVVSGSFAPSVDFMERTSIVFYSDDQCTVDIQTGSPTQYENAGIEVHLPPNQITPLSAASFNGVGNKSDCSLLEDYNTYDTAPPNLTVNATQNGALRLNWLPDSTADPTPIYRLKRATQAGGPYNTVYSGLSTSFTDLNVTEAETYFYVVQATNSTGQTLNSSEVVFTTDAPPPQAAAFLSAYEGPGQASLTWSGFPQNMKYVVLRGTQSGGPYEELNERPEGGALVDMGLVNDVAYYYVVKGFNPEGISQFSNEARVVPRGVPAAPIFVQATPVRSHPDCNGNPGIDLEWTEPSHYDTFKVRRQHLGDGGASFIDFLSVPHWRHCNPGGYGGASRVYTVTAQWGPFETDESASVVYRRSETTMVIQPGDGFINVTWSAHGDADQIDIYRSLQSEGPFELYTTQANVGSFIDAAVSNGVGYYYYIQAREGSTTWHGLPTEIRGAVPGPAPVAPTNVMTSVGETGTINLRWSLPTHFNGFNVYRADNPGGPFLFQGISYGASFIDSFPPNGMNYYQVTTRWGLGETAPSAIVGVRRGRVQNLEVTNNPTDIGLIWDSFPDASDYRVERAENLNGPWSTLAFETIELHTDTTALPGVGYFYRVTPRFSDTTEGQPGEVVRGQRTDNLTPSGFEILAQQSTAISFMWHKVPGASLYDIELATDASGPFTNYGSVKSASVNVLGLLPRIKYFFRVTATVGANQYSSELLEVATLPSVLTPSGTVGNNQIDVTWSTSIGATSYDLLRSTDGVNFTPLATGLVPPGYLDTTTTNGNVYFYRVIHHYAGIGERLSPVSQPLTPGTVPLPPQGLTVTRNTSGFDVSLSWTSVAGATSYLIEMATSGIGGPYSPQFSTSSHSNLLMPNLNQGQTYYFRVRSRIGTVESAASSPIAVKPYATPPAPDGSYVSSTELLINWPAFPAASSYKLYRSVDGIHFNEIASGLTNTSYNDTVAPEIGYYYRYEPIHSAGDLLPVSQTSPRLLSGTVLNAPAGLVARGNETPEVILSWARENKAESYEIYRSNTSGAAYSLIDTVVAPNLTWTDTSVVMGQDYFYRIRALNHTDVPSPYSAEVNVRLQAGPSNLSGVNNGAEIDLSWDSLPGATQYRILRSRDPAGSFGDLGTSSTTTFSDSDVQADVTYHYQVRATFASGASSLVSDTVSVTKTGFLNIAFPVELIDRGIASSDSEARTFARSQTRFNTDEFDGSVSYELEVVALNSDSSDRVINLVDSNESTLTSMTVPAGTSEPTRIKQAFSPPDGSQTWRLQLAQTSFSQDLIVSQARVIVRQVNATKTSIYIPLLSSSEGATHDDLSGEVVSTTSSQFNIVDGTLPYVREASSMVRMVDINPWTLEVVVSADSDSIGEILLENIDQSALVGQSLTEFDQQTPTVVRIPLPANSDYFSINEEGEAFGLSMRCQVGCLGGQEAKLYKAGLWVKLENLREAQLHWRTSLGENFSPGLQHLDQQRFNYVSSDFTNPQIFWQVSMISDQSVNLASAGSNDSGVGGSVDVAGSILTGDGLGNETILRSGPLSLSSDERYILKTNPSANFSLTGSMLIINTAQ